MCSTLDTLGVPRSGAGRVAPDPTLAADGTAPGTLPGLAGGKLRDPTGGVDVRAGSDVRLLAAGPRTVALEPLVVVPGAELVDAATPGPAVNPDVKIDPAIRPSRAL